MLDKIYEFIANALWWACGGFMVQKNGLGLSITDTISVSTSGSWGTIWNAMTFIADNVFEPIAATIVCIMFFVAIIEKSSMEKITGEQMIREIIKLVMGLWLTQNCTTIMTACINIGNGFISKVSDQITAFNVQDMNALAQQLKTAPFLQPATGLAALLNPMSGMMFAVVLLGAWLILAIIVACLLVICEVRKVEIMLKTAVAPLALCDTFGGNFLNSHAMNFVRSFLATCLQGVFIVIAVNIIPLFASSLLSDLLLCSADNLWPAMQNLMMIIVTYLAVLVITFKSGSIAKEIMGAR